MFQGVDENFFRPKLLSIFGGGVEKSDVGDHLKRVLPKFDNSNRAIGAVNVRSVAVGRSHDLKYHLRIVKLSINMLMTSLKHVTRVP